jgi:hypothetical protein
MPSVIHHPVGTFQRLKGTTLQLPLATLWARTDAFESTAFLETMGFYDLGQALGPIEVPRLTTLFADMRAADVIRICLPGPPAGPVLLVEASFGDAHDASWASAAHQADQLCILVSPKPFDAHESAFAFLTTAWIAALPLGIYAFPTGVGTHP